MSRIKLYKYRLDCQTIMIASRFFNSIDDFINLELCSKRFRLNTERFFYNPISLTQSTIGLFPNIQTLHIYSKRDKLLQCQRIIKYVIWYSITYEEYLKFKKNENIIFKKIVFENKNENEKRITIPNQIHKLSNKSFSKYSKVEWLLLHHKDLKISHNCFDNCFCLTNLTLPKEWKLKGNKIFNFQPNLISFEIPKKLKVINGQFIEIQKLTKFEIPSEVSKIENYCFKNCIDLKELKIYSKYITFGKHSFYKCPFDRKGFPQIKENEMKTIELTKKDVFYFEDWTNKKINEIIFDSSIDDMFNLQYHLSNRNHIIVIFEIEKNMKCGCYLNKGIDKYNNSYIRDMNSFLFLFKDTNHHKFDMISLSKSYQFISRNYEQIFIFGLNEIVIKIYFNSCTIQLKHASHSSYDLDTHFPDMNERKLSKCILLQLI